jgi:hypothetical protein
MSTTTSSETLDTFLEKHGSKAVTYRALNTALDALQDGLVQVWKAQKTRVAELELRIKELEARPPGVEYDGVYETGKSYTKGVLVSRRGGLWLSLRDDNGWAPGQSPLHWKLVVKSHEAER